MKTCTTTKLIAVGTAAALALPLTASARHHSSGDVFAGAVIGVIAGAMLANTVNGETVYVAPPPPPPPPPPVYYYYQPVPVPAPTPYYGYYAPPAPQPPPCQRRRPGPRPDWY